MLMHQTEKSECVSVFAGVWTLATNTLTDRYKSIQEWTWHDSFRLRHL